MIWKSSLIVFVIILINTSSAQTESSEVNTVPQTANPEDYVVLLKFYINEERLPETIGDIINATDTNISSADLMKLGKINVITLEKTLALLSHYNISAQEFFSVNSLEKTLNFAQTRFSTFYNSLLNKLGIKGSTVTQVLLDLNIDAPRFFVAVGTDSDEIYNILREGNYEENNTAAALSKIEKSRAEVFESARDIILEEYVNLSKDVILKRLWECVPSRSKYLELWEQLNITTESVYAVEALKRILEDKVTLLNQFPIIGTVTSHNTLVIHKDIYDQHPEFDDNSFKVDAKTLGISGFSEIVAANVVELKLRTPNEKFVTPTVEAFPNNCTYITFNNAVLVTEEVFAESTQQGEVIGTLKTETTIFIQGSPLVCNSRLYGIAGREDDTAIYFHTFSQPVTEPPVSSANYLYLSIVLFVSMLFISL